MKNLEYPNSALEIANYFLNKEKLTLMKLQKLIYFAHGWYLAINNSNLIDEPIQAWEYGPAISSVYHEFKVYGNTEIDKLARHNEYIPQINEKDQAKKEFLDVIWDTYRGYGGVLLSNITHIEGTPWDIAKKKGDSYIDNEVIKKHFTKMLS